MRKQIVAGNWKMNTSLEEGKKLINELLESKTINENSREVIVSPPFTHLQMVAQLTEGSFIKVSAQNCAFEKSGAYTGEVSVDMIHSTGAEYVIIGHSERRQYFHEDGNILLQKLQLVLNKGLIPIFCVGEQLAERENGTFNKTVGLQLQETIFKLSKEEMAKVILAYEPVWAIGTGKVASPQQAQDMHAHIRQLVNNQFGKDQAASTRILYGGSCKPNNASELFGQEDVDGGLIGGAALKASDFIAIINA